MSNENFEIYLLVKVHEDKIAKVVHIQSYPAGGTMNPIIRIMGIIDLILVALILFYTLFPASWLSTAGAFLVLKGGLFAVLGDFISYFDVGIGIYLVVLSFGLGSGIISIIAMMFLVQKGLASML